MEDREQTERGGKESTGLGSIIKLDHVCMYKNNATGPFPLRLITDHNTMVYTLANAVSNYEVLRSFFSLCLFSSSF